MAYYHPNQQYASGGFVAPQTVSPQHLFSVTNVNMNAGSSSSRHQHPPKSANRGVKLQDVGSLRPGEQHQLSYDPVPTAQAILNETFQATLNNHARDIVTYVPRLPQYSDRPSLPSIVFAVQGKPGPYLRDILKQRVVLDGAHDLVLRDRVWKQTSLTVDWPGVITSSEYIPCVDRNNRDLTRTEIAQMVAQRVAEIVQTGMNGKSLRWGPQRIDAHSRAWKLKNIDYRDVRLIAINYYKRTWIPVLAVDA